MPFLGGFVFPHGAITLDPETRDLSGEPAYLPTTKENCIKLHEAMKAQAEKLVGMKPDVIIMSTPHGLRLTSSYVFAGNDHASGNAGWDGKWTEFTADIQIDGELTGNLVNALRMAGDAAENLGVGDMAQDVLPLRWAEVISWWFITEAAKAQGVSVPQAVILGQPMKRLDDTQGMIPELMKLGKDMWTFIRNELGDKRVAVVISCDLSHCHSTDPTSPYPFNEDAVPFDNFMTAWAKLDIDRTQASPDSESNKTLLNNGGTLVNHVLSCGYSGLVLLQGILTTAAVDPDNPLKFTANLMGYSWPTYFGMMVCNFTASPGTLPSQRDGMSHVIQGLKSLWRKTKMLITRYVIICPAK